VKATDIKLFYRFDQETGSGADPVSGVASVSFSFEGLFALIVDATIEYSADEVRPRQQIGGVITRAREPVDDLRPMNTSPLLLPPGEPRHRITTTAIGATPPPGTVTNVLLQVVLLVEGVEIGRSSRFRVSEAPNVV